MGCYRVRLRLRSGLGTPLAADTLWGHLAWGKRFADGEAELERWLSSYEESEPPLVISDPMPAGFWPVPAMPAPPPPSSDPGADQLKARKDMMKRRWLDEASWDRISDRLEWSAYAEEAREAPSAPELREESMTHAGINRLSGGTAQPEGGTLFSAAQFYADGPTDWDVWCHCGEGPEQLRSLFEAGLSGGYGRDKSTGLGQLSVMEVAETRIPSPSNPNAGVLLAAATPTPSDPARGFTPMDVRCGRLGGLFATGSTPNDSTVRQKRPVHVITRGSLLIGEPQAYAGQVLAGVHEDPAIRHYAMAPILPCRVSDALLEEARA